MAASRRNAPARTLRVPSREVTLPHLISAMQELLTPAGVQASTDHLFKGAVFGRDSLRVAEDLMPWFPSIARQVAITLARHQGKTFDLTREEEPGRIHHEYRADFLGFERVGPEQRRIMEQLAAHWGWLVEGRELCYYGTVDATPQFVRLICDYVARRGGDFLDQEFQHRDTTVATLRESLLAALGWIVRRLHESPLGLLEFRRTNPHGLRWQVMRDGALSYAHEDGTLANAEAPVASLEVQGLAYDALTQAAGLLEAARPQEAREWRRLAGDLQTTVFGRFWMEDVGYFAMALDRAPDGTVRQVRTLSTVAAELLETGIFDSLPGEDRWRYVEAIVRRIYSEEFLTDAGIRARGLRHWNLFGRDLWEYHSSRAVWAVMTNVFARGLRRQGFPALARDMETRMLNAAGIANSYAEFFYVDRDGRVVYDPKGRFAPEVEPVVILGTNIPERTQAWTVSALLRSVLTQAEERRPSPTPMERELLPTPTRRLRGRALREAFPTTYAYRVDTERGRAIEREVLERAG